MDPGFEKTLQEGVWDPVEESLLVESLKQRMFGPSERTVEIGRYRLRERLAHGAMGVIYRAEDPNLDREVVLKLLHVERNSEQARLGLLEEAKALAEVDHPNVVKVYDSGTFDLPGTFAAGEGEGVFMVMQYVRGPTLREWLAQPRTWREALIPLIAAGEGLAAVHRSGLVHRDFKPSNVVVGQSVRIVDFGLASRGAAESVIAGTPGYMAPEQFDGEFSPLSDQYAYCVALWTALYGGGPPLRDPDDPRRWVTPPNSKVPSWLHDVVRRGVQWEPADRFPNMETLLLALRRDPSKRRRNVIAIGGAVVSAGAIGFVLAAPNDPRCTDPPLQASWTAEARSRLRDGFARADATAGPASFSRVEGLVDEFVGEYLDVRAQACGLDPGPVREDALVCLHNRELLAETFLQLIGEFESELLQNLGVLVSPLRSTSDCLELAQSVRAQVNPDVLRVQTLLELGRIEDADALLTQPLFDPQDRGVASLMADVECYKAALRDPGGAGVERCREAWIAAERVGNEDAVRVALRNMTAGLTARGAEKEAWETLRLLEAKDGPISPSDQNLSFLGVQAMLIEAVEPDRAVELWEESVRRSDVRWGDATFRAGPTRLNQAASYLRRGGLIKARLMVEDAEARLRTGLPPEHPFFVRVAHLRGALANAERRYSVAEEHLRKALAGLQGPSGAYWGNKTIAEIHAELAEVHLAVSDPHSAKRHALAALRLTPQRPSPNMLLGMAYLRLGEPAQALVYAKLAWLQSHDELSEHDLLNRASLYALVLVETGDALAAWDILEEAAAVRGTEPWAHQARRKHDVAWVVTAAALGEDDVAATRARSAMHNLDEGTRTSVDWAEDAARMARALKHVDPALAQALSPEANAVDRASQTTRPGQNSSGEPP